MSKTKSPFRYKLLTWLIVCAQIVALVGVTLGAALQPTPSLAQARGGYTA